MASQIYRTASSFELFLYLAGVHGSRTHLPMDHIGTTVLKTARPTGTLPLPRNHSIPREAARLRTRLLAEAAAQVVLRRDRRRGAVAGPAHDLAGGGRASPATYSPGSSVSIHSLTSACPPSSRGTRPPRKPVLGC